MDIEALFNVVNRESHIKELLTLFTNSNSHDLTAARSTKLNLAYDLQRGASNGPQRFCKKYLNVYIEAVSPSKLYLNYCRAW